MNERFSFDDFHPPPTPPKLLYKYLSPERVGNVLEGGTVRFTPLLNTNDSFEVRSTFHKIAGPRFHQILSEQMDVSVNDTDMDQKIAEALQKAGLGWLKPEIAKKVIEKQYGSSFTNTLCAQMKTLADMVIAELNAPKNVEKLLNKLGRELLCFSLSERYDSSPMWAHYASNHTGFVVALDTGNDWFQRPKDKTKKRLQKVTYFDGKVEEPFEDPYAALMSKLSDWSYEREWRLYATEDTVDKIVGGPNDPIHLVNFPPDAIKSIIVGAKASEEDVLRIRTAIAEKYPSAKLFRAKPDPSTHSFQQEPI